MARSLTGFKPAVLYAELFTVADRRILKLTLDHSENVQMIKAILFDISGVLHVDQQAFPGAVRLLNRLQQSDLQLRFVTNTSRTTSQQTLSSLQNMGFQVKPEQIFTAPGAVRQALQTRKLRPFLLIHPNLEAEFA
ncbi:MAG: hypothetical protein WD177_04425, partial [Methylophaga sp.]